jgi:hypothetical protein
MPGMHVPGIIMRKKRVEIAWAAHDLCVITNH